jgi:hypothetical protein
LNFEPSIATLAAASSPSARHRATNCPQTRRIAIGRQATRQPHHLDIAPGLALQAPARLNPIEIAVDIQLQQNRRMIGRTARRRRCNPAKTQPAQIQFIDKHIDHPNRVVVADPLL